jgi:hypothetical protein
LSGQLLAVKNTLGEIVILDTKSGELACKLNVPTPYEGSNICFTQECDFLISGTWDGRLEKYRISDGELVDSVCFPDQMVTEIQMISSHNELVVMHGRYGKRSLSKLSARSLNNSVETTELPDHTKKYSVLPDGTFLIVRSGNIELRNGNTHTAIYDSKDSIIQFCINNASDLAAIVHADTITIINVLSRATRSICEIPFACAIEFSPVADELAVGSAESGVFIFGSSEIRDTA